MGSRRPGAPSSASAGPVIGIGTRSRHGGSEGLSLGIAGAPLSRRIQGRGEICTQHGFGTGQRFSVVMIDIRWVSKVPSTRRARSSDVALPGGDGRSGSGPSEHVGSAARARAAVARTSSDRAALSRARAAATRAGSQSFTQATSARAGATARRAREIPRGVLPERRGRRRRGLSALMALDVAVGG